MVGKVLLKKERVESALRLYCLCREKCMNPMGTLIVSLIEACDGLMFNEIKELTGFHERAINACLHLLASDHFIELDENLLPGRDWISKEGSKGVYKVLSSKRQHAQRNVTVPKELLKPFARTLFNIREHFDIMEEAYPKLIEGGNIVRQLTWISSVISALVSTTGLLNIPTKSQDSFRQDWVYLSMLGYGKEHGKVLNKRAYMLDKRGVMISEV